MTWPSFLNFDQSGCFYSECESVLTQWFLVFVCCASGLNVQPTACFLSVCWFVPAVTRRVWTHGENNGWYILVINYISIGGRKELRWSWAIYTNNLSFTCRSACSIRHSVQNKHERRRCVYHQTNNSTSTSEVEPITPASSESDALSQWGDKRLFFQTKLTHIP